MANAEIHDITLKAIPSGNDEIELQEVAGGASKRTTISALYNTDNHTDGTTNKVFTALAETKLAGIETAADVTDTTNVIIAGALMNSEVDADIKTFALPANTTISAFGATLVENAAASNARTTLGLVIGSDIQGYAAVLDNPVGKQTYYIPAKAMSPTFTDGCKDLALIETTAGRPDIPVLWFDASSDEHAQFEVELPKQWNGGTVTFKVKWTSSATDTDGVAWALQGVAVGDGDTIDVAFGTAVVVTDDAQSTAEDLYVTAESAAVTIAGTPAEGDTLYFDIYRDVSDGNDDMAEDGGLLSVTLFWTNDALRDD